MKFLCALLLILLVACGEAPAAPTLTPTHQMTGPTIEASPRPFLGPPTEGPPPESGFVGANDPTAAAQPSDGVLPPIVLSTPLGDHLQVEVAAADNSLLQGALYKNPGPALQAGVLLLGDNWGDVPAALQGSGFTVLAMPVRDESDVAAIMDALGSGFADPARLAVVGAAADSVLALRGCALAPGCDAAALVNATGTETALSNALALYGTRPLLLLSAQDDATVSLLNENAAGDFVLEYYDGSEITALVAWLRRIWA